MVECGILLLARRELRALVLFVFQPGTRMGSCCHWGERTNKGKSKAGCSRCNSQSDAGRPIRGKCLCSGYRFLSISSMSDFPLMLTELFLNLVPLKCFVLKIMLSDTYHFSTNNSFLNVSNNISKWSEKKGINLDDADEKGCSFLQDLVYLYHLKWESSPFRLCWLSIFRTPTSTCTCWSQLSGITPTILAAQINYDVCPKWTDTLEFLIQYRELSVLLSLPVSVHGWQPAWTLNKFYWKCSRGSLRSTCCHVATVLFPYR